MLTPVSWRPTMPFTSLLLAIASILVFKFSPIATATPYFPNTHLLFGVMAAVVGLLFAGRVLLRRGAASRPLAYASLLLNAAALLLWVRYISWFTSLAHRSI